MAPAILPVRCSIEVPRRTSIVIIGAGIVGLTAALALSERGIPVVVLEKGRLAGEQSSRNLGWVRKMGRSAADVPLSLAADKLWRALPERVSQDVGYRQAGIMYLAKTEAEMAKHEAWLASVESLALDSRMLAPAEIDALVPGGERAWAGALHTPSDGRAEPALAASAIATAAIAKGAIILEHRAVRTLSFSAGRVNGVVTEYEEIGCEQVLLAGGLWSRRFLGNLGASLPTLPLIASVMRTAPMDGPTDIAVGGPDFSFRKRLDGGYTVSHRGALGAPLMLDHLLIGHRYLAALKHEKSVLNLSFGRDFVRDLLLPRRWSANDRSPFERVRSMDPPVNDTFNRQAMANLVAAWPQFAGAVISEMWAGAMDVTPDSLPVIGPVECLPGLTIASGFSGHGFGTAPAAGQLAADLIQGGHPIVDPAPYRFDRF